MTADVVAVVRRLWANLLPDYPAPPLAITGGEAQLPSSFRVEQLAAASIAASHLAASVFNALQTATPPQAVALDTRSAAIAFRSERYLRVNGHPLVEWAPLTGDYLAGDGRWVRLHCNFPHHAHAAARALSCNVSKDAFVHAVGERAAFDVEEAVLALGGASGAARSRVEWMRHPHFSRITAMPLILTARVGDADPILPTRSIHVLDLTRIISGPLAAKALAAYGADVLHIASSRLPTISGLDIDHGWGKRACDIDLTSAQGASLLRQLIRDADVLVESYRPGALERRGFGFDDARQLRPDIVYLSLSAYGDAGPWGGRRGFDSVVQMTSGIAAPDPFEKPRPLPCQALDHATGYLASFAILCALINRTRRGGAWHIKVSLCRTAELLWELGQQNHLDVEDPTFERVRDLTKTLSAPDAIMEYVPVPGRIGGRTFTEMSPPRTVDVAVWK